jgi:hypothetical protein
MKSIISVSAIALMSVMATTPAHAFGCKNQTAQIDGVTTYVYSKCTWNDAPASQTLLDMMTVAHNTPDTDNQPEEVQAEIAAPVIEANPNRDQIDALNVKIKKKVKRIQKLVNKRKVKKANNKPVAKITTKIRNKRAKVKSLRATRNSLR